MSLPESIDPNNIPKHLAVIMDGNGRWARKAGAERSFGHESGIKSVRETVEGCVELGVKYLTLYAFSTENWNRPADEIEALMTILINSIISEKPTLDANSIKLHTVGNTNSLPENCQKALQKAIDETASNTNMTLTLALSYSGRWDIVQATKKIAESVRDGKMSTDEIDESLFSTFVSTADMPEPELMIRTSGELRISNFLLWQLAYSEIYVTETLWPDFTKQHLYDAIKNYQQRERRFGKTGEQINTGQ